MFAQASDLAHFSWANLLLGDKMLKITLVTGAAMAALTASAYAADCPVVLNADANGAFPGQFELAEFQELNSCALTFAGNPSAAELNARIRDNGDIPAEAADRLPAEPLVIAPYQAIGEYGSVLNGLSNATEAGTSDLLSVATSTCCAIPMIW